MTLDEAVKIMHMPDPTVCGYPDGGKMVHLQENEGQFCVICGKRIRDIKALSDIYEQAKHTILSVK